MKRIWALTLILLLCAGCAPQEDAVYSVGTEDGGGSGYGVSVHRCDCPNAAPERRTKADEGRWLKVSWAEKTEEAYRTSLQVTAKDRMGLIVDVSTVLSSTKTRLLSLNARSTPDGFGLIEIEMEVTGADQLRTVVRRQEQIPGEMRVIRPAG